MPVQEESIELPDLKQYSDVPLYNTRAAVQQTGILAPTLRAWERRYSILSPARAENTYRLYSERDIAIISWLQKRLVEGMSISQAVALFRYLSEKEHVREVYPFRDDGSVSKHMAEMSQHLLEAFIRFDESKAQKLMDSMLAMYSIEQLCADLITPTMHQIGAFWEEEQVNVSIEHFASAFFRSILAQFFRAAPAIHNGPLSIVCCTPGELHELAPFMLSLLLRRRGLHVAYLGQSIENASLLQSIHDLSPALICVSLTMPDYVDALITLGQHIDTLPISRPGFAFGGQCFETYPHLVPQLDGVYLTGDLHHLISQLHHMAIEQDEHKN